MDPRLNTLIEDSKKEVAELNEKLKAAKKKLRKLMAAGELSK